MTGEGVCMRRTHNASLRESRSASQATKPMCVQVSTFTYAIGRETDSSISMIPYEAWRRCILRKETRRSFSNKRFVLTLKKTQMTGS